MSRHNWQPFYASFTEERDVCQNCNTTRITAITEITDGARSVKKRKTSYTLPDGTRWFWAPPCNPPASQPKEPA